MDMLVVTWFVIIAFCIVMYVILDGFTLGTGIVLHWASRPDRDIVMSVILPTWDGNQTWLVLGGASLYGAFPLAFSTLLPMLYLPLILMVLALLFRGVVFEFRLKSQRGRKNWDRLYILSSVSVAFIQGVVLGTFVEGFNTHLLNGVYHFVWLTPFTLTTGVALVCGYGLLGATRLILKTEGALRDSMVSIAKMLMLMVAAFMVIITFWSPLLGTDITTRWFEHGDTFYLAVLPIIAMLAFILFWYGLYNGHDKTPYWSVVVMFLTCYAGVGYSVWPYIVPHSITIWQAAAPHTTLAFILPGAVVMIPFLLLYTGYSYRIFRGKVKDVIEY